MSSTAKKAGSLILIMLPILLLVGVGVLNNNFKASGFQTTAASSSCTELNCPAYQATGCAQSSTNCSFSGSTTYSFLDPNSPFTYLVKGDLIGFVTSWFTNSAGSSAYGASSNQVTFTGNGSTSTTDLVCPAPAYGTSGGGATFSRVHYASAGGNLGGGYTNSVAQVQCNDQTFGLVAGTKLQAPIYLTFLYWNGNIIDNTSGTILNATTTFTNIVPANDNSSFGYTAQCYIYGNSTDITNMICSNFSTPQAAQVSTLNVNFFNFIGLVGGVILLWLGLGISGSFTVFGTGITFGENEQGSKLCGSVGFGLILWIPIYSEFGSWLSLLGFGLSSILYLILVGSFFAGIYQQTQSYF